MYYYALLGVATLLFSLQFIFIKKYQQLQGVSIFSASLQNVLIYFGMAVFSFCMSGFKLDFSLFSFLLALAMATILYTCNISGIKTLGVANLSLYTMFIMIGGMFLPFIYGVFMGEEITVFKIIGIVILLVSNCIPVSFKEKGSKKAIIYYIGIFVCNGLVGIVTSIHSNKNFVDMAVGSWNFITWYALIGVAIGICGCIATRKDCLFNTLKKSDKAISLICPIVYSLINGTASYITLICVDKVGSSAQYPIITGGCIFFGLLTGLVFKEKPNLKTIISVIIAVIGTVLFII